MAWILYSHVSSGLFEYNKFTTFTKHFSLFCNSMSHQFNRACQSTAHTHIIYFYTLFPILWYPIYKHAHKSFNSDNLNRIYFSTDFKARISLLKTNHRHLSKFPTLITFLKIKILYYCIRAVLECCNWMSAHHNRCHGNSMQFVTMHTIIKRNNACTCITLLQ